MNEPTATTFVALLTMLCLQCDAADSILISDVTLISPERLAILEEAWVLIEADRIVGSGTGEAGVQADQVIDGEGRYLMPGLIDGHVHLQGAPGMAYPIADEYRALVDDYYEQLPRSYLYFGFTTVVDLNVLDREFIESVKNAQLGPAIFDCDSALALANGYPMVFLPPETRFESHPNFLYDERQAGSIPHRYSPDDHTPAAAVRRVADAGGICVKTHHEDGFGPQSIWPTPSKELISEVIGEAHMRDLKVLMHANSHASYRFAVDAGVDVIVHGMWNWDDLDGSDDVLPVEIASVADKLLERNIGFMPTLRVLGGLQSLFDPGFLDDPQLRAVLPARLIDWYRTSEGQWFVEEMRQDFGGLPDDQSRRRIQTGMDQGGKVAKYLVDKGGRLVFGSDTPSSPTYGNPPGYNGFLELKTLAEYGIAPGKLLHAATIGAARAFRLDEFLGTIETGKIANLLVLNENPLTSVQAYDTIELVIVRGKVVPRHKLSAE